jgi:putative ABC transport system permease protein
MIPDDSPDSKVVAGAPGVLQVAPRLKFTGLISFRDESLSFLGEGLDTDREVGGRYGTLVEAGEPLANSDPAGIILGQGLAKNLGVSVGDTVVLVVNKRGGSLGGVEAKVRGTFSTPTKAYDDVAAQVPYAMAKEVLQVDSAHAWVMYLDETAKTTAALDYLSTRLSADLEAVPWFETADFYNKTVKLFSRQVLIMKLIIGLVVILSISNTMMMSVMERTNEIATSMAVGVRRGRVLSQFLFEGLLIGLAGGAMGVGLGYALAHVISIIGIPMPPPPGMARGFIGEIIVTPNLAWEAMLLATTTALIASIQPAWRASRMIIVDALRHGR